MALNLDYAKYHDEYHAWVEQCRKDEEKRRQEWWAEYYQKNAPAEFEPLEIDEIVF